MTVTRKAAAAVVLASAWCAGCARCSGVSPASRDGHASARVPSPTATANSFSASSADPGRRHVILLIGDGMQREHEIAASRYLYGSDDGMRWHQFPHQGYSSTWDIDSYNAYAAAAGARPYAPDTFDPRLGYDPARGGVAPYPIASPARLTAYLRLGKSWPATDSAAAATAMSTGFKTDGGNIAWRAGDPANGALTTIAETLRAERGFAIGVITTVPFTHATPAAFVSHDVDRNHYHAIGAEIVNEVRPDVVVGGGHPRYTGRFLSAETYASLQRSTEYAFVERKPGVDGGQALLVAADTAVAEGRKLFGIFGGQGGNFEYRAVANAPGAPEVGIGNAENPTLAQAAEAALRVVSADPDGFFLMIEQGDIDWANHDNAYASMIGCMADLDETVRAVVGFIERPGDAIDWANTLVLVTADHANSYLRLDPDVTLGPGELPSCSGAIGAVSCTTPAGRTAVTYGTGGHTNELVTLSAMGFGVPTIVGEYQGRWYPGTKIVDNTDLYRIMMNAAGISR